MKHYFTANLNLPQMARTVGVGQGYKWLQFCITTQALLRLYQVIVVKCISNMLDMSLQKTSLWTTQDPSRKLFWRWPVVLLEWTLGGVQIIYNGNCHLTPSEVTFMSKCSHNTWTQQAIYNNDCCEETYCTVKRQ